MRGAGRAPEPSHPLEIGLRLLVEPLDDGGGQRAVIRQPRVGGDDLLGLAASRLDDPPVASHPQQIEIAAPPRLGRPQHVALAPQLQVRLGQGEAVGGLGEGLDLSVGGDVEAVDRDDGTRLNVPDVLEYRNVRELLVAAGFLEVP